MVDGERKTYNLGAGRLHFQKGDKECFCALGVYAAERGIPVTSLDREDYSVFAEYTDDLKRMAEVLMPLIGRDIEDWGTGYDAAVLSANDMRDYRSPLRGELPFKVPVEKVKEALSLVGIDVELNDVRGKELRWLDQE